MGAPGDNPAFDFKIAARAAQNFKLLARASLAVVPRTLRSAPRVAKDVQAKYEPEGLTYQLRLLLSGIEAPRIEVARWAAQHIEPL